MVYKHIFQRTNYLQVSLSFFKSDDPVMQLLWLYILVHVNHQGQQLTGRLCSLHTTLQVSTKWWHKCHPRPYTLAGLAQQQLSSSIMLIIHLHNHTQNMDTYPLAAYNHMNI